MAEPGPILVTGATGFLGSSLVPLLLERGYEVHAIVRAARDHARLSARGVHVHGGDLERFESLLAAAQVVASRAVELGRPVRLLHAAALISYRTRDAEAARRVNVEGTRLLLDACQMAGIPRALVVSSVVAVGFARTVAEELSEDAVFNGAELRSHYVTTKRAAEDFALAVGNQLEVVVASPAAIFGPSERPSNTTEFLRRFAAGSLGPFAPPGSLGVVGLEDAALGTILALERGQPGQRYLLCESNWTLQELFELAARAFGRRAPRWRVPRPLWSLAVGGVALFDRIVPGDVVTPQSLRLLGVHFRFGASRARGELGWEPRAFPQVLEETARWMRRTGIVSTTDGPEPRAVS